MRQTIHSYLFLFIFFFSFQTFAQFNVLEKVKKKVNRTIEKNIDKTIDKTVDGTEKEIKEGASGNEENPSEQNIENDSSKQIKNKNVNSSEINNLDNEQKLKLWSKYNFVPGDKIILDDNLSTEENGEFPSRWDLISGNAENAIFGEDNVINFAQPHTVITPLMDKEEYLPEVFTLEFDAYFDDQASRRQQRYSIQFWTHSRTRTRYQGNRLIDPIIIDWNSAKMYNFSGQVEGVTSELRKSWKGQWKHIALSFNKRSLKVFLDENRLLNIPNLGYKPKMFSIGGIFDAKNINVTAIKNIRIAEGGKDLYDRVIADGRFSTTGILFDVNKSTIKPESMGVINEIVKMMRKHEDLKFSIEGHTDSDGDDNSNQTLSEKRAEAVKITLIEAGIDESRFSTKGFGESVPVDNNSTPEGKANNRRVEFVKI